MGAEDNNITLDEERRDTGYLDMAAERAESRSNSMKAMTTDQNSLKTYVDSAYGATKTPDVAVWTSGADMFRNNISNKTWFFEKDWNETEKAFLAQEVLRQKLAITSARLRYDAKKKLTQPGEPLDYSTQADRVFARISRDLREASHRLLVASDGLRRVYGYAQEYSLSYGRGREGGGVEDKIESSVLWCRDAIQWLSAFSQHDQAFSTVISIKEVVGAAWPTLAQVDGSRVEFDVSPDLFKDHRYVRLRGLSAVTSMSGGSSPLYCSVSVPAYGVFFGDPRTGGETDRLPVDQRDMPTCTLGNVNERRLPQSPEIAGAISLMNASPIADPGPERHSKWSIVLSRVVSGPVSGLEDVLLEIRAVGQPVTRV